MYEGALKALTEYKRAKEIVLIDCTEQYQPKQYLHIEKGNKTVQSIIAGSVTVPTAVERWNKNFEEFNWRNIFSKCQKNYF